MRAVSVKCMGQKLDCRRLRKELEEVKTVGVGNNMSQEVEGEWQKRRGWVKRLVLRMWETSACLKLEGKVPDGRGRFIM